MFTQYLFMIIVLAVLAVALVVITLYGVNLTNDQYDRLKGIVIKWSGITTFLGVIVATFKTPYGNETITLVAAIGALLSYMLGVSDKNFTGGALTDVDAIPEGDDDEEDDI